MQAAVNVHRADREGVSKAYHASENTQLDFFYIVSHLLESATLSEGSHSLFAGAKPLWCPDFL